MSRPDKRAKYVDTPEAFDDPDTETSNERMPPVRTLALQALAVLIAILLHVLRRQKMLVFGHSLENWTVMPPECLVFTAVTIFMGGPIIFRDFKIIRKWLGWGV